MASDLTVLLPGLLVELTADHGTTLPTGPESISVSPTFMESYIRNYGTLMEMAEWIKFAEENGCADRLVNSKPNMNGLSQTELYVLARHPEMSNCRFAIQKLATPEYLLGTAKWHANRNSPEMIYTALAENPNSGPEVLATIWHSPNYPVHNKVKILNDNNIPAETAIELTFEGKPLSETQPELIQALARSLRKRNEHDKRIIVTHLLNAIPSEGKGIPHYSYPAENAVKMYISSLPVETIKELVSHNGTGIRNTAIEYLHLSKMLTSEDIINYCNAYKLWETLSVKTLAAYPETVNLKVINDMLSVTPDCASLTDLKAIHPDTPYEELQAYFKKMDAADRLAFVEDFGCLRSSVNTIAWKDRSIKVKGSARSNAIYKYPEEFWSMLEPREKNIAMSSADIETIENIFDQNRSTLTCPIARLTLATALTVAFESGSRNGKDAVRIIEMVKEIGNDSIMSNLSNRIIASLEYATYREDSDILLMYLAQYSDSKVRAAIPAGVDEPPMEVIQILANDPDPTVAAAASALVVLAAIC